MKPVLTMLPSALLSGVLAAQALAPMPRLTVDVGAEVVFTVAHANQPFFAAVGVSLTPGQRHWFQGLPPILDDVVVLGVGFVDHEFVVRVPQARLPILPSLYSQR